MADKGKGIADDSSSSKRKRNGDDKSGNRKRKNLNVLQFFEDSAFEIEESGSSDDEDFINDDINSIINDDINMYFEDHLGPDPEVKPEPKTPNVPFFPKEEEMTEEEMDKLMEERYKPGANFVKYAENRTEGARRDEYNTVMPSENEPPPIWKVKCTVGRERHSAFCLMQKYVDLKALGTKLEIISVFAVEHVKGYIYIETLKQCDINEACKGLCYIYPSRVAAVPLSELPHLFSVRSKYSGVSVDTWARVKNGKYKGDLRGIGRMSHPNIQERVQERTNEKLKGVLPSHQRDSSKEQVFTGLKRPDVQERMRMFGIGPSPCDIFGARSSSMNITYLDEIKMMVQSQVEAQVQARVEQEVAEKVSHYVKPLREMAKKMEGMRNLLQLRGLLPPSE